MITVTIGNIRAVMTWEEFARFVEMEKARAEQAKQKATREE